MNSLQVRVALLLLSGVAVANFPCSDSGFPKQPA